MTGPQTQIEAHCVAIADTVVSNYRNGKRSYSCTSQVARMWQAAYDGAAATIGGDNNNTHPAATGSVRECGAKPDHDDIMETIQNAADDWQKQGYTSALAEVRDMANVGRALMEALPKGYCYMDCPSEIVSDLQNELDEALAAAPTPDAAAPRCPTADELEAAGKAPWQGEQPIEEHARQWKGRPWVPLEAAISDLQFWQRRDYEHSRSASLGAAAPDAAASKGKEVAALIQWARNQMALPDGSGWLGGHIDENHRYKLRDLIDAIDAALTTQGGAEG